MLDIASLLFPSESQLIETIPLSESTIARRIKDIGNHIATENKARFAEFQYYSIAIDESTDATDSAQLLIFIRGITATFQVSEELAAVCTINANATGYQIFCQVFDWLVQSGLPLNRLVNVTTDGAPSMMGSRKGFIAFLSNKIQALYPDKGGILFLHCIIHQEALAKNVVKLPVTTVVNQIVNYIRGSKLKHRKFRALVRFSKETNKGAYDVNYYCSVRWLSLGDVLRRFYELLPQIVSFLKEENVIDDYPEIQDDAWKCDLAFAVDLFDQFNTLNTFLQGKGKFVFDLYEAVDALTSNFKVYSHHMAQKRFNNYPKLKEHKQSISETQYKEYSRILESVHTDFANRFQDFKSIEIALELVASPFDIDPNKLREPFQSLVLKLQHDEAAKEIHEQSNSVQDFFHQLDHTEYHLLKDTAQQVLVIFASTYTCECTFSVMKFNKSKHRSTLSDENLEHILRIHTTNVPIDFEELATQKLLNYY